MGGNGREVNAPEPAGHDRGPEANQQRALEVERLFRDQNDSLVRFLTLRLRSRNEAREVAQRAEALAEVAQLRLVQDSRDVQQHGRLRLARGQNVKLAVSIAVRGAPGV